MKITPSGLLRRDMNPDVRLMICTAGHVDHGKTRLVELLTGCRTDRLREEQERGMTIDLGFAPCSLGGNLCAGIVDVPGHEKFIRNMVAGVSGIDMCIFVVAADDGIMPQTVEHLHILELLGVRYGIVALTKIDLVAPERVEEVAKSIRNFLRDTFLGEAPILPVSAETCVGYEDLYEALAAAAKGIARRKRAGVFRMPVERTFQRQGFGTVVTGIPLDGVVRAGGAVELVPGGRLGKIRSLQCFLRDANEGGAGQCLALNVPEFAHPAPKRGQVLCAPGMLQAAAIFHARVRAISGMEKPVQNAEALKFHTGTSETPAKIYLLEGNALAAGESALVTVVTSEPVAAAVHDRFLLRRPSPAATIGGGEILGITREMHRPRRAACLDALRAYEESLAGCDPASPEGMERRILHCLRHEKHYGAPPSELFRALLLEPNAACGIIAELISKGNILRLDSAASTMSKTSSMDLHDPGALLSDNAWLIDGAAYQQVLSGARRRVIHARDEEKSLSIAAADLQEPGSPGPWPEPLAEAIQAALVGENLIAVQGNRLALQWASAGIDSPEQALQERIRILYVRSGFHSPRPEELPGLLGAPSGAVARAVEILKREKQIVQIAPNVILAIEHLRHAQEIIVRRIREKGALDSADFKYDLDSTRKYALAILDYFDSRRLTFRTGNERRLAPGFEKFLI